MYYFLERKGDVALIAHFNQLAMIKSVLDFKHLKLLCVCLLMSKA